MDPQETIRTIVVIQLPIKSPEEYRDLMSDDQVLVDAIQLDIAEYDGEIWLVEKNAVFTEDGVLISFYEDELDEYEIDEESNKN